MHRTGSERLAYPARHIEADNRLAWMTGRLEEAYGDRAWYVHLQRDPVQVVRSFVRRAEFGIMKAYREGILLQDGENASPAEVIAGDYLHTVTANIRHYLRDKSRVMEFRLEHAREDFQVFWEWIGARGDLHAALAEWEHPHNASANTESTE